jgi:hypothetical protein
MRVRDNITASVNSPVQENITASASTPVKGNIAIGAKGVALQTAQEQVVERVLNDITSSHRDS